MCLCKTNDPWGGAISLRAIGPLVPEKKIFKIFFTIYGHGGHLDHVIQIWQTYSFPQPIEAPYELVQWAF